MGWIDVEILVIVVLVIALFTIPSYFVLSMVRADIPPNHCVVFDSVGDWCIWASCDEDFKGFPFYQVKNQCEHYLNPCVYEGYMRFQNRTPFISLDFFTVVNDRCVLEVRGE